MALTLEQAKNLKYGQVLYHIKNRNADGSPTRFRVTGKPKTWKTMPERVQVPVKYGMYSNGDYITERNHDWLCLKEWEATGTKITFKKVDGPRFQYYNVIFGKQKIPYKNKYEDRKIGQVFKDNGQKCWFNNQEKYRFKTRMEAAVSLLNEMLD